jgi:hypothetical protein
VSRRILVKVSPFGEITVEADGFQGKGCEAATKAIEEALGKRTVRTLKPEHRHGGVSVQQQQQLGGS